MSVNRVRFSLDISWDSYLLHYRGVADNVQVRANDGRRVQFPANLLRRYITREGIHGEFFLSYDAQGKVVDFGPV